MSRIPAPGGPPRRPSAAGTRPSLYPGVTVLELTDPRWEDFVAGQPLAMPFHHPCWGQLIARCYSFRSFALAISDAEGQIRAGLPVVEVRHLYGDPKWVSLPFTDCCPPLAASRQDEARLAGAVQEARRSADVRRVEVRGPLAGARADGGTAFRHVLRLDRDPLSVYSGFHHSQVRRNIRRAEREGLTTRWAERPEDLVQTFYQLHLRTRHRHGVPVQPRRFFRLLWENAIAKGLGSVLIVEASGRPVAAGVFLAWKETMIYKFGASDVRAWPLRPNHLLLWHAIRAACDQGYRWLDLGRTDARNEGLREFKRAWGAAEEPLIYCRLGDGHERPAATDRRASEFLGPVIRHTPLLFCRALGEGLYRHIA